MRIGIAIAITGLAMFSTGLVMFYLIELGQTDPILRFIKNTGTFVGISGMGVFLAGVVLFLINKNEPQLKEHTDV
jgi:hypothetical protein